VKPIVLGGRLISPPKYLRAALPPAALRECVPQSDLTETLLSAYDKVALAAHRRFLSRGALKGRELEDWLEAEREILGLMEVDVAESAGFVTALASLPGYRSAQVTLGIEPRWLLIFACRESDGGADKAGMGRSLDPLRGPPRMDAASLAVMCSHAACREQLPARAADTEHASSNLFCILELPAEVDPARCTAILSNGLLGVRMFKTNAKSELNLPKEAEGA
jgi:HSP20 family molecular chaperone IbpA